MARRSSRQDSDKGVQGQPEDELMGNLTGLTGEQSDKGVQCRPEDDLTGNLTGLTGEQSDSVQCKPEDDLMGNLTGLTGDREEIKEEIARKKKVYDRIYQRILRLPRVVAVDIGYVVTEHKQRFEPCIAIRIHVNSKLPWKCLKQLGELNLSLKEDFAELDRGLKVTQEEAVPPDKPLGRLYVEDVPIDIIEANYTPSQIPIQVERPRPGVDIEDEDLRETVRSRVNPLVGGISVGNRRGQAGTLGAVVWDLTDGTACILSNWHVLSGETSAGFGAPCYQPAIFDGGQPSDKVASLKRWILNRHGDAALAEIIGSRHFCSGEVLGLRHPINDVIDPFLGMKVRKWGRSTGFTKGFVDGVHLAINLDYGNGVIRHFEDQYHIAPRCRNRELSEQGDSGALLVTNCVPKIEAKFIDPKNRTVLSSRDVERGDSNDRRRVYYAAAMLFAGDVPGSRFGEFAVASSLKTLARELQFSLRPVFVPRKSILPQQRDLLSQLQRAVTGLADLPGTSRQLAPGAPAQDTRTGGPQPTPEPDNGGG